MEVHAHYGLSLPEEGWVPSPTYLMRRDRVLHHVRGLAPGRAVEIGCGPGALLHDLAGMGHRCVALETSPRALELAHTIFDRDDRVEVRERAAEDWAEAFDLVLAFEVLEHIEDDRAALAEWVEWLRPGGRLLLSVPAHEHRWNPTDEWAGHFRRYPSEGLRERAREVGLEVEALECYGFPLTPLLETVRARTWQRGAVASQADQTAGSGVERRNESRFYPLQSSRLGVAAMRLLFLTQRAFLHTELSNGFLMVARKRERP